MKKIRETTEAIAEAVKLCRPKVIPIYPITPQTHNVEALARFVANGELDASLIHAESEHSAMSAAIGASATGARTYTATSSQGLKYMSEVLFIASGMRLPIVMMVANRTLSSPINIWNDHSDSLAERDSGWIQFYAESAQEAVDRIIQAFKIAEKCLIPVMVCLDGFVLTHSYENVDIPSQNEIDSFLPMIKLPFSLNPDVPVTMGAVAPPAFFMEIKKAQHEAMLNSLKIISSVQDEFSAQFSRNYNFIENYRTNDAEKILVCMGTSAGTAKVVVDNLREKGKKVGLVKISLFRPFPREEFIYLLSSCKKVRDIIVMDRAVSVGNKGILFTELRDVLFDEKIKLRGYIAGLGGRDITQKHIEKAFSLREEEWLL